MIGAGRHCRNRGGSHEDSVENQLVSGESCQVDAWGGALAAGAEERSPGIILIDSGKVGGAGNNPVAYGGTEFDINGSYLPARRIDQAVDGDMAAFVIYLFNKGQRQTGRIILEGDLVDDRFRAVVVNGQADQHQPVHAGA